MRHLMICISGWAGTGKDECAGRLVKEHHAFHTGLADPGKRHGLDTYGFTEEQLWGPSKFRNAGDPRYPKPGVFEMGFKAKGDGTWEAKCDASTRDKFFFHGKRYTVESPQVMAGAMGFDRTGEEQTVVINDTDPAWFLSPREYLQLYMELCNQLYGDTWIDKGIADHRLLAAGGHDYSKLRGVFRDKDLLSTGAGVVITCYSDFRHIHEHRKARANSDGTLVPVLVRIKRPTVIRPPFKHRSETEQTRIRDAAYDFVINNDRTLEDLYTTIDEIVRTCSSSDWKGKDWSDEYVLAKEQEGYSP